MKFPIAGGLLICIGLLSSYPSFARLVGTPMTEPVYGVAAKTHGLSNPPIGWVTFCQAQSSECDKQYPAAAPVILTSQLIEELKSIDNLVNHSIEGISDNDHYGIYKLGLVNWWTYPDDGKGNCNDYAILKKKLLVEAGWPASELLLTVVLDHHHEGHLILMARTDLGDLVLDNLADQVKLWHDTGYTFLKRQSEADPNDWLAMEPGVSNEEYAAATTDFARHQQ